MTSLAIPFQVLNWDEIPKSEHKGIHGTSYWQTIEWQGLRVRIVTYSAGYFADHWCTKGHVIYCLEGSFISELADGFEYELSKGMSYVVSDNLSSHRSRSDQGAKLLIIDGDFLSGLRPTT